MVIFGLGLNGCAPKEPDRYYNKDEGFSIKLPNEWEKKEGFMGTTIVTWSPQESSADQFRENVNVAVEELPKALSLEEYFQLSLANLSKLMTDFQEHEKGQLSIDNNDAKWLIYSHRMGTVKLKVLVYMLVKGRRGYAIVCSAAPEQFLKYRDKFEEIVQSFKFE